MGKACQKSGLSDPYKDLYDILNGILTASAINSSQRPAVNSSEIMLILCFI